MKSISILAFSIVLVAMLALMGKAVNAAENSWAVPLSSADWKVCPELITQDQRYSQESSFLGRANKGVESKLTSGYDMKAVGGGMEFSVLGNSTERRSMVWPTDAGQRDLGVYDYAIIRYKANGIARDNSLLQIVYVSGKDASGKSVDLPVINSSQITNDGKWHSVIFKKKFDIKADTVNVRLYTEDSSAYFVVGSLEFRRDLPVSGLDMATGAKSAGQPFESVDLGGQFNYTYAQALAHVLDTSAVVDGTVSLPSGKVVVGGIPFNMEGESANLIHPAESSAWKNETVELMGIKVPHTSWRPIQRDDKITVEVGKKVSEVYMVLVNEFPVSKGIYALPARPYCIEDIEGFAIELEYADGDNDLAFPYSIADKGYILRRMAGVYAVPADSSRVLKRIVIKNRNYGVSTDVAAVTVNTAQTGLYANLWKVQKPARVACNPAPKGQKAGIQLKDKVLTVSNSFGSVVINCRDGFVISGCKNLLAAKTPVTFDGTSGLEVTVGNKILTGRSFKTVNVSTTGRRATIDLQSRETSIPLGLTIQVQVDDSAEIHFKIAASNNGNTEMSPGVRFPVLRELKIGKQSDTWYMFPQFRNVNSNENGFCKHMQDTGFPMQFFDVYNPVDGSGITFMTHNLTFAPVEYGVSKNDSGVRAYIEYPSLFYKISPGGTRSYVESTIGFHTGDWHQGMGLYQKWLASWYRPVNAQNKSWWSKTFLYRSVLLSDKYSRSINQTPPMYYDPVTREYHIDEAIKLDKEYYEGVLPEMYLLSTWAYDEVNDAQRDGEYSTKDYDHAGGLVKFKAAIEEWQKKYGVAISTYTIADRYNKDTEFAQKYGGVGAFQRYDGWVAEEPLKWYACRGSKVWRDYIVNAIAKMAKETGMDAVYHDVLGTPSNMGALCWRAEHNHEIPSWNNKCDFEYVSAIRAALPDKVFWSEYPVSDVNCQYTDGWICYDFLTLHDFFARWYDRDDSAKQNAEVSMNTIRYVFPKIKQFGFPVGQGLGDWSNLKFLFFNGQGWHDGTYFYVGSDSLKLMNKAHRLQKKYADCFTSANPTSFVNTDMVGVYANRWPGKGRTVWTLYNTKYTTVRGQVISIAHKPGATYYDVWNDKTIAPKIKNGVAIIDLKLYPQGLGCIAQNYPSGKTAR